MPILRPTSVLLGNAERLGRALLDFAAAGAPFCHGEEDGTCSEGGSSDRQPWRRGEAAARCLGAVFPGSSFDMAEDDDAVDKGPGLVTWRVAEVDDADEHEEHTDPGDQPEQRV